MADKLEKLSKKGTKDLRQLVRETEQLPIVPARTSPVQTQLSRLSEGSRALVDSIPKPVRSISRHSFRIGGSAAIVVGLLAVIAVAGCYMRLLRGPISFAFLVPRIQNDFNAQLKGYRIEVGDAILRLSDDWGLEFRLANVSVRGDDGKEIANAPLAAIDLNETALLKMSVAPASIELIGPKLLVFENDGSFGFSASPGFSSPSVDAPRTTAGRSAAPPSDERQTDLGARFPAQAAAVPPGPQPGTASGANPVSALAALFSALEGRGSSSSSLKRVGVRNANVYFSKENRITAWAIPSFHVDIEERNGFSSLTGELSLMQDAAPWRISFRAINRPQQRRYAVTATVEDVVPRQLWKSYPSLEQLKLVDLPVSASLNLEVGHSGALISADSEVKLGKGRFFAPWDAKHPADIDGGTLRVSYDKAADAFRIVPFEMRWNKSVLNLTGAVARRSAAGGKADWVVEIDGGASTLAAEEFGVPPIALDTFRLDAVYKQSTDSVVLNEFRVGAADAQIAMSGEAAGLSSGGAIRLSGNISPMPLTFLKVIWPTFVANGARDWIGSNVPTGRVTGGSFAIGLSKATLASLDNGGDVPSDAVSLVIKMSGLKIFHLKGVPPILTRDSVARVTGRRFTMSIPSDAKIEVPSGKVLQFTDGQFLVDDLRPEFPRGEISFKGQGEAAAALELLDLPPLGYVKAVGFKPNLVNGQVATTMKLGLPLLKEPKFEQMSLSGKTRVTELKSNALPAGLLVNGGAVTFDLTEASITASGDVRVNGIPVSLAWQRVFSAPTEKQPPLRVACILTDKARDDLALNVNHIVKGDLPLALGVVFQKEGPPKIFMEANLTQADIFLTAIGWRKVPGQKASVNFDLNQRSDNSLQLDNFRMTGDGINIAGQLTLNDKKRIAGFDFPEFSTNQLTQLAISGELTPGNILKIQAKGGSFDARQFFRSLLSSGKPDEKAPPPLKDEPGMDLSVEIGTLFGHYDATLKSVTLSAKRRGGKITFLDVSGRLNGDSPIGVRMDQKSGQRVLVFDATDAGSTFRLLGLYGAMRSGQMTLKVNLDTPGQAEKTGTLFISNFAIAGDQVVGRVVSRAEQEGAKQKPGQRNVAQAAASGEPLQFDKARVAFGLQGGQLVLQDFTINGPVLGATVKGRVDFGRETVNLSGTYVPLYGLNSVLGNVPLLGELFTGGDGGGVVGITFAVQGRTSNPDVMVNPLSMMAPGFLRQLFQFDATTEIETPPAAPPAKAETQRRASKKTTNSEN